MAIYMWREPDYLCFTANTAGSTMQLAKIGSPTAVSLETSTDKQTWSTYTIGNSITLSNVGDKVYFRNTSEITTGFSTGTSNRYRFLMGGSISASGDIGCLLNKNSTTSISSFYCFGQLFVSCASLVTPPSFPATNLTGASCYDYMFLGCSNLASLPILPATTLPNTCYRGMFQNCSKIKLSTTQTGEYQTAYRIPATGTGTVGSNSLQSMFYGTGGSFADTAVVNTTYYTSNTLV